jgi:ribosomal protein S18 acetylase RimI-like enzyme
MLNKINFLSLDERYCYEIAELHITYLNSKFTGNHGAILLESYYKALCARKGGVCYIAMVNNRVVGYICGIWNLREIYYYLFRKFFIKFLTRLILQTFENPTILLNLINKLTGRTQQLSDTGYELRPIVVSKECQGKGVASELLKMLLVDAKNRGYEKIHLKTETDNNRAQAFYEKSGFILTNSDILGYFLYERSTNNYDECQDIC